MLYYPTQTFMIIMLNQGYKKRSLKNIQVKIKHSSKNQTSLFYREKPSIAIMGI